VIQGISAAQEDERRELEAVLASPAFARSARLEKLLSYLCEKYFAGDAEAIKEYNIGVEALGRRASFDPSSDAIARVEVHRLRRKLREYYEDEGAAHPIQITIPVGSYVPVLFFPTLGTIVLLRWLNIFVYEHLFLCIPLSIGFALLHSRLWEKNRAQEPMPI